jgi:glycosyltransferase involved in cell wall biosynthesis
MRLHAFLLVRDEGDIIAQTLAHLAACFDRVHVLDTGSTDETWPIVQDFARCEPHVTAHARWDVSGNVGRRAYMFERVRETISPGDWIARVDADEFYHIPPRDFLREFVAPHESRVFAQHYEFVVLRSELDEWERIERDTGAPPPAPQNIQRERTRCILDESMWFEYRLFRFRRTMRWHHSQGNPFNPGLTARLRIPIRHYRWRSLAQMRSRLALRAAQSKLDPHGDHWQRSDSRAWIIDDADPRLRTWYPGCPNDLDLPDPRAGTDLRHLEWPAKRRKQIFLYRSGLPHLLDLFRTGSDPAELPATNTTSSTDSSDFSSSTASINTNSLATSHAPGTTLTPSE